MAATRRKGAKTPSPSSAGARRAEVDDELEKALEDTFPASDPVSLTRSGGKVEAAEPLTQEALNEQLDEGLRETFPASDPPAVTSRLRPGRRRR